MIRPDELAGEENLVPCPFQRLGEVFPVSRHPNITFRTHDLLYIDFLCSVKERQVHNFFKSRTVQDLFFQFFRLVDLRPHLGFFFLGVNRVTDPHLEILQSNFGFEFIPEEFRFQSSIYYE